MADCSSHSIQLLVGLASPSDLSATRCRARAMAAHTAAGSASMVPSPSTSRTTSGVITSGPASSPGGRRFIACRQSIASFAVNCVTPASSVWSRIT